METVRCIKISTKSNEDWCNAGNNFLFADKMVKSGKGQQKVAKQFFEQLDKDQDGRITRVSCLSD